MDPRPLLVVLAGLPGTGKTTLARVLAAELGAVYLRVDVITIPMLRGGLTDDPEAAAAVGYDVAAEIATENLQVGTPVVVDGVHATHERRAIWPAVAARAHGRLAVVETTLTDRDEHRRRVEARRREPEGHLGPSWSTIESKPYDAWDDELDGPRLLVETSSTPAAVTAALGHLNRTAAAPRRG